MNKALEALEKINEIILPYSEAKQDYLRPRDVCQNEFEIIETTLKEHELMKEIRITARFDLAQVNKEHKALDIIKETRVDTNIIKESKDYNDYCGLEAQKMLALMFSAPKQKGITEEQYELLKEVLL